ncbi:hypothetical protein ACN47E_008872 [Coniothyrium glycines]
MPACLRLRSISGIPHIARLPQPTHTVNLRALHVKNASTSPGRQAIGSGNWPAKLALYHKIKLNTASTTCAKTFSRGQIALIVLPAILGGATLVAYEDVVLMGWHSVLVLKKENGGITVTLGGQEWVLVKEKER